MYHLHFLVFEEKVFNSLSIRNYALRDNNGDYNDE